MPTDESDSVVEHLPDALLGYQREAILRPDRFTWNNWSRQAGKSYAFTLRRLLRGIFRRRTQLLISAGERQGRELMLKLREHCERLDVACRMGGSFLHNCQIRRLELRLPNGVRMVALPANPTTVRGYTGDVFLDEFAMHRDDQAIWAATFPSLMRQDGEIDIASTPRGRDNLFHRLRDNPAFYHSTVPLTEAIAQGLPDNLELMRAAVGDERIFRQEFMCEFDDDAGAFMSFELITACGDPQLQKAPDALCLGRRNAEVFAGMDVGRKRDPSVIWLWEHCDGLFFTRGLIEMADRPFAEQHAALDGIMRNQCVRRLCIDATGMGVGVAEHALNKWGDGRVEAIVFTPRVQASIAHGLRLRAELGQLRIPVDDSIMRDWHSVRRLSSPSGHARFEVGRSDGHADRFWAAALGLHAAGDPAARQVESLSLGRRCFAREGTL